MLLLLEGHVTTTVSIDMKKHVASLYFDEFFKAFIKELAFSCCMILLFMPVGI